MRDAVFLRFLYLAWCCLFKISRSCLVLSTLRDRHVGFPTHSPQWHVSHASHPHPSWPVRHPSCTACSTPSTPFALHPRTAAASLVYSPEGSSVDAVVLADGRQLHANAVVSAAGAWMRELMPVPMVPHKGQMMSLRQPEGGYGKGSQKQGGGLGLTRVFFAEGCYIIPKRDGRIVVGSTVEVGGLCVLYFSWDLVFGSRVIGACPVTWARI